VRTNAEEVINYVGQIVSVCDTITSSKYLPNSDAKITLLNMGKPFPDHSFTVVIDGEARKNFPFKPEDEYLYKVVCVSGVVKLFKGKPQIYILSPLDLTYRNPRTNNASSSIKERADVTSIKKPQQAKQNTPPKVSKKAVEPKVTEKSNNNESTASNSLNQVHILKSAVQVRSGPGTSFDVIATLKAGKLVSINSNRNGWCQIIFAPADANSNEQPYKGFVPASILK
jgi:hypothetical protein